MVDATRHDLRLASASNVFGPVGGVRIEIFIVLQVKLPNTYNWLEKNCKYNFITK